MVWQRNIALSLLVLAVAPSAQAAARNVLTGPGPFPFGSWTLHTTQEFSPDSGDRDVVGYHRIPYALPPVSNNAFRKPIPIGHGNQVRNQNPLAWGNGENDYECTQSGKNLFGNYKGQSDCLYLNVYRPNSAYNGWGAKYTDALPVAVWIHGGAMVSGNGASLAGMMKSLARRGTVVVSVNYRLGMPGFVTDIGPGATNGLQSAAGDGQANTSGNYGLWDQHEAIKWVQANISRFGGDPNQISIFGESSGGYSVMAQVASPRGQALNIQNVAQNSGPLWISKSIEDTRPVHKDYLTRPSVLGKPNPCYQHADPLGCFRWTSVNMPFEHNNFFGAVTEAVGANEGSFFYGAVDTSTAAQNSAFMTDSLMTLIGQNVDIPIMTMGNEHEGNLAALIAHDRLLASDGPSYVYGPEDVARVLDLSPAQYDALIAPGSAFRDEILAVDSLGTTVVALGHITSDVVLCHWHVTFPEAAVSSPLVRKIRNDESVAAVGDVMTFLENVGMANNTPTLPPELSTYIAQTAGHAWELVLMNSAVFLNAEETAVGQQMVTTFASFFKNPWHTYGIFYHDVTVFEGPSDFGSITPSTTVIRPDSVINGARYASCGMFEDAGMLEDEFLTTFMTVDE